MSLSLVIGVFVLLACLFQNSIDKIKAQGDPASEVIQLVNQLRASYGQAAYQVDPILMSVAQAHASWQAANNISSHLGPDGKNPDERAKAAGYGAGYQAFVTENVGSGTLELHTPELVVTMWQGDFGHLNAMISAEYEDIGVGYAEGFGMSWFVMNVGWVDEGTSASPTEIDQPIQEQPPAINSNPSGFVVSTPDENGGISHKVQEGQALWTIAVNYDIPLDELLRINNLTENSFIYPGDLLIIRPAATATNTPEPTPLPATPAQTGTADQQGLDPAGEGGLTDQDESPISDEEGREPAQDNIPVVVLLMLGIITILLGFFIVFTRPNVR